MCPLIWWTYLYYHSFMQNNNNICVLNCREPVSNHNDSSSFLSSFQSVLYYLFWFRIQSTTSRLNVKWSGSKWKCSWVFILTELRKSYRTIAIKQFKHCIKESLITITCHLFTICERRHKNVQKRCFFAVNFFNFIYGVG